MNEDLIIVWNDNKKTYNDHYPAASFKKECKNKVHKVTCIMSGEKPDVLDFYLTVKDDIARCDFEKIHYITSNKDEEIKQGILKIIFTDNNRDTVDKIFWKKKESPVFDEDKKATWNWV